MRRPFLAAVLAFSLSVGTLFAESFLTAWDVSPLVPGESSVIILSGSFDAVVKVTLSLAGEPDSTVLLLLGAPEIPIPVTAQMGQEATITLQIGEGEGRIVQTLKRPVVAEAPEVWVGNLGQPIGVGLSVSWKVVTRKSSEPRIFQASSGDLSKLEIKSYVFPFDRYAEYRLVGVAPGITDYTLEIGGFAPIKVPVEVVNAAVVVASPRTVRLLDQKRVSLAFGPPDAQGQGLLSRQSLASTPGLNFAELISHDPGIVRFADFCAPDRVTYTSVWGGDFHGPQLFPAAIGRAKISVKCEEFLSVAQSTAEVEVLPPALSLQGVHLLGAGLQERFVCVNGRTIRFTSSEPDTLALAAYGSEVGQASIVLHSVYNETKFTAQGLKPGKATIIAETEGFPPTLFEVDVVKPTVMLSPSMIASPRRAETLRTFLQTGVVDSTGAFLSQELSAWGGPRIFRFTSSDPAVAEIETATASGSTNEILMLPGNRSSLPITLTLRPGKSRLSFGRDDFVSAVEDVTVEPEKLTVDSELPVRIALNHQVSLMALLPSIINQPMPVEIKSDDPTKLRVLPSAGVEFGRSSLQLMVKPRDVFSATFMLAGFQLGETSLTISAEGLGEHCIPCVIEEPTIQIEQPAASLSLGKLGSLELRSGLWLRDRFVAQRLRARVNELPFSMRVDDPEVVRVVGPEFLAVKPAGQWPLSLEPLREGSTKLHVFGPGLAISPASTVQIDVLPELGPTPEDLSIPSMLGAGMESWCSFTYRNPGKAESIHVNTSDPSICLIRPDVSTGESASSLELKDDPHASDARRGHFWVVGVKPGRAKISISLDGQERITKDILVILPTISFPENMFRPDLAVGEEANLRISLSVNGQNQVIRKEGNGIRVLLQSTAPKVALLRKGDEPPAESVSLLLAPNTTGQSPGDNTLRLVVIGSGQVSVSAELIDFDGPPSLYSPRTVGVVRMTNLCPSGYRVGRRLAVPVQLRIDDGKTRSVTVESLTPNLVLVSPDMRKLGVNSLSVQPNTDSWLTFVVQGINEGQGEILVSAPGLEPQRVPIHVVPSTLKVIPDFAAIKLGENPPLSVALHAYEPGLLSLEPQTLAYGQGSIRVQLSTDAPDIGILEGEGGVGQTATATIAEGNSVSPRFVLEGGTEFLSRGLGKAKIIASSEGFVSGSGSQAAIEVLAKSPRTTVDAIPETPKTFAWWFHSINLGSLTTRGFWLDDFGDQATITSLDPDRLVVGKLGERETTAILDDTKGRYETTLLGLRPGPARVSISGGQAPTQIREIWVAPLTVTLSMVGSRPLIVGGPSQQLLARVPNPWTGKSRLVVEIESTNPSVLELISPDGTAAGQASLEIEPGSSFSGTKVLALAKKPGAAQIRVKSSPMFAPPSAKLDFMFLGPRNDLILAAPDLGTGFKDRISVNAPGQLGEKVPIRLVSSDPKVLRFSANADTPGSEALEILAEASREYTVEARGYAPGTATITATSPGREPISTAIRVLPVRVGMRDVLKADTPSILAGTKRSIDLFYTMQDQRLLQVPHSEATIPEVLLSSSDPTLVSFWDANQNLSGQKRLRLGPGIGGFEFLALKAGNATITAKLGPEDDRPATTRVAILDDELVLNPWPEEFGAGLVHLAGLKLRSGYSPTNALVTSSNPDVLLVSGEGLEFVPKASIALGGSNGFALHGISVGSAEITFTAQGVAPLVRKIEVIKARLFVSTSGSAKTVGSSIQLDISFGLASSTGFVNARVPSGEPLKITIESRSPDLMEVVTPTSNGPSGLVEILPNESRNNPSSVRGIVVLRLLAEGRANAVISHPLFQEAELDFSIQPKPVEGPKLTLFRPLYLGVGYMEQVRAELRPESTFRQDDLFILTSSDPSILLLSNDLTSVPHPALTMGPAPITRQFTYVLHAVGIGQAKVVAKIRGIPAGELALDIQALPRYVAFPANLRLENGSLPLALGFHDAVARTGGGPINLTLRLRDPLSAELIDADGPGSTAIARIQEGKSQLASSVEEGGVMFRPLRPGPVEITVFQDGFPPGTSGGLITGPLLSLETPSAIGLGLEAQCRVKLDASVPVPLEIKLVSNRPTQVELSQGLLIIPAGATEGTFIAKGLSPGISEITASLTNSVSVRQFVSVSPPNDLQPAIGREALERDVRYIGPNSAFRFPTARGHRYHLEKSTSLLPNQWEALEPSIEGTGEIFEHIEQNKGARQLFFRVREIPGQ